MATLLKLGQNSFFEKDESILKVIIRNTMYGNFNAYIGKKRVMQDASKTYLIIRVEQKYPNAEIIDKTN